MARNCSEATYNHFGSSTLSRISNKTPGLLGLFMKLR